MRYNLKPQTVNITGAGEVSVSWTSFDIQQALSSYPTKKPLSLEIWINTSWATGQEADLTLAVDLKFEKFNIDRIDASQLIYAMRNTLTQFTPTAVPAFALLPAGLTGITCYMKPTNIAAGVSPSGSTQIQAILKDPEGATSSVIPGVPRVLNVSSVNTNNLSAANGTLTNLSSTYITTGGLKVGQGRLMVALCQGGKVAATAKQPALTFPTGPYSWNPIVISSVAQISSDTLPKLYAFGSIYNGGSSSTSVDIHVVICSDESLRMFQEIVGNNTTPPISTNLSLQAIDYGDSYLTVTVPGGTRIVLDNYNTQKWQADMNAYTGAPDILTTYDPAMYAMAGWFEFKASNTNQLTINLAAYISWP